MAVQMTSKMPESLWREKAELWLNFSQADAPTVSIDRPDDDHDPEPPPAAPAVRPWPRVFPGL